MDHLPLFAGMSALKDNEKIADILAAEGALTGRGDGNPFLSAFMAQSCAADFPQHAAMVYLDGKPWPARYGAESTCRKQCSIRRRGRRA